MEQQEKNMENLECKQMLCANYKLNNCQKGRQCMFSHDKKLEKQPVTFGLSTEQKKLNNVDFEEKTEIEKNGKEIENKNENKQQKQQQQSVVKTKRICDYFIDALITGLDNWKWQCPNGQYCIYKHSLPSGYIICKKEEVKQIEDFVNEIDDKNDSFQQEPQSFFQQPIQKPIQQRSVQKNNSKSNQQQQQQVVPQPVQQHPTSFFQQPPQEMETPIFQTNNLTNPLLNPFLTTGTNFNLFPAPIIATSGSQQQTNIFSNLNDQANPKQKQSTMSDNYKNKIFRDPFMKKID